MIRFWSTVLVMSVGFVLAAAPVDAQRNCKVGKPCGNSCISRDKVCRIGAPSSAPAASAPSAAPSELSDAQFVASSRGRVYYWIGCSAWRQLSTANLRYFKSRTEAEAAGLSPSQSRGCAGPGAPPRYTAAKAEATAPRGELTCVVARVVDGDTINCEDGRSVRLLLVDAPEMDQGPFGALAKSVIEGHAPRGTVLTLELDVERVDGYGRTLAYAHKSDGTMLNEELVRAGAAVVSVYPPNVKHVDRLRVVADSARAQRRGLWSLRAFECLPADHRAGRC